MFTPGQLIRHQRHRRGWTQADLARAGGIVQCQVSRYESETQYPSWPVLCRLLAAMGMQPRVIAEPCDISQHGDSAWARSDFDERLTEGIPPAWREGGIDLSALLAPHVSETPLRRYHLLPVLEMLDGLEYVLVGRIAMRMHGLGCSVPRVEAVVAAEPGPEIWRHLSTRLEQGTLALWSSDAGRYCWQPTESLVGEIASLTTVTNARLTELSFRTRDTATELRVLIRPGPRPPFVVRGMGDHDLPLLAISELVGTDDPELREAFRRIEDAR